MQASNSTKFGSFVGEDGERLTLRLLAAASSASGEEVEVSLECGERCFRTVLDRSEVAKLRDFLGLSYRDAEPGFLAFSGESGERLVFRHSNMGEPYREGVQIRVEGVDDFPDYLGPFVESSEIRHARAFIA